MGIRELADRTGEW